ncbi:ankyrin repeat-containing domain protein [Tribonema minus]|uniref:Ankyrin repeat-containing domain protein n=1 Tax=Tribonema minus TaxID=303371 RepID=A0A835YQZ2_9STRA|nr:ankyrin repeat-containing domain protein [Tribonema minus]
MANKGLAKFWDGVNSGKMRIVRHYMENGARPDMRDGGGRTPLHYAAISGLIDMAKYLMAKGATVDVQNTIGLTPLFYAARYDHLDMCRYLLETAGADISIEDNDGRTALHLAARFGHPTVCRYLLSQGADADSCDNRGHRPDEGENFFANVDDIDQTEIRSAMAEARSKGRQRVAVVKAKIRGEETGEDGGDALFDDALFSKDVPVEVPVHSDRQQEAGDASERQVDVVLASVD